MVKVSPRGTTRMVFGVTEREEEREDEVNVRVLVESGAGWSMHWERSAAASGSDTAA
jgi:hypothetical protein